MPKCLDMKKVQYLARVDDFPTRNVSQLLVLKRFTLLSSAPAHPRFFSSPSSPVYRSIHGYRPVDLGCVYASTYLIAEHKPLHQLPTKKDRQTTTTTTTLKHFALSRATSFHHDGCNFSPPFSFFFAPTQATNVQRRMLHGKWKRKSWLQTSFMAPVVLLMRQKSV